MGRCVVPVQLSSYPTLQTWQNISREGIDVCCVPLLTGPSSLTSLRSSVPPSASWSNATNLAASTLRLLRLRRYLGICPDVAVSPSGLCGIPPGSMALDGRGARVNLLLSVVWISCVGPASRNRKRLPFEIKPYPWFTASPSYTFKQIWTHIV